MQSLTDTEKRLTIHLEGKLHTGYALIRKTLADIKQRREEYRRTKEKESAIAAAIKQDEKKLELSKETKREDADKSGAMEGEEMKDKPRQDERK